MSLYRSIHCPKFVSKDPLRFNRRQILENNYVRWWTKRHKVSWYIKVDSACVCIWSDIAFPQVKVDEENIFKFMDASLPESSRDLILHQGDLDLSCCSWQFGRTPSYSDKHLRPEWELEDPEEDAAEDETAKRPHIAGHPKNNNNNKNDNNNLK